MNVVYEVYICNLYTYNYVKMSTSKQFIDSFWGSDILSTAGFDALCKRAKMGRATCKDVSDFLQQRAKIEMEYSRSLQRLARAFTRTDIGESHTLSLGWFQVVSQTEKISEVHEDASNLYKSEADRLAAFMEEQRTERHKVQDCVRKSQANKISLYNKTNSLQKTYYARCRDANSAKQSYETAKLTVATPQRELDKLKQKMEKCASTIEQADTNYRNCVESLTSQHNIWQQDMVEACQIFQFLEEARIDTLRRKFWTYTNVGSKVALAVDDCYEAMRQSVSLCDIDQDLDEFIVKHATGQERPRFVEYVNFYSTGRKPHTSNDSGIKMDPATTSTSSMSSSSDVGEYDYALVI